MKPNNKNKKANTPGKTDMTADLWQNRIAEFTVIALMCALPLYLSESRYIGLTGSKYNFFIACMCITLLGATAVWVYRLTRRPRLFKLTKPSVADLAVLGFAVITVLSTVLSPFKDEMNIWTGRQEPEGRYDGAITQLCYIIAFFVVAKWYKPRRRDFIIFAFTAIAISLIGILQFYGMDFLNLWPNHMEAHYQENYYNIYFRSTLGNINIVATYACVSVLLCGFLYVGSQSQWRFLYLTSGAFCFWLMLLADSDSGFVGTVAASVIAFAFIVTNRKVLGRFLVLVSSWLFIFTIQRLIYNVIILNASTMVSVMACAAFSTLILTAGMLLLRYSRERVTGANIPIDFAVAVKWKPAVLIIVGFIVITIIGIEIFGRNQNILAVYEAREMMHGRFNDDFASYRIGIWRHGLRAFPNHPFIGTGPDTFLYAYPDIGRLESKMIYNTLFDKAHNEYLQILICQGYIGLMCYLFFIGGIFVKAFPAALKNPLLLAVTVAFAGYCVQAFFNISIPIASQMMWVLAGMMTNNKLKYLDDIGY